jgi:hypothetical protein
MKTNLVRGWQMMAAGACMAIMLSMPAVAQRLTSSSRKSNSTAAELLPLTCAQAWAVSNRNYDRMIAIVKTLAHVSLINRDLMFPNTREAGLEAGKAIAEDCKADPNALLFAIVDTQVKRIAVR